MPGRWAALVEAHRAAVEAFAETAATVPEERWLTAPTPGKWSAGEIATHLALAYEVAIRELETGVGPRVVTPWWMRAALFFTVRRRLLAGAPFPRVRAPREARPAEPLARRADSIARFRERAEQFERVLTEAASTRRRAALTHPYLGRFGPADALRFTALHVRHHHRQLEDLAR